MYKKFFLKTLFYIFIFLVLNSFLFSDTKIFKKVIKDFKTSEFFKSNLTIPIIAVLPFESDQNIGDMKINIYEKFLEELLKSKICRLVDRENIDKIVEEKKLETLGLIDPNMCRSLGEFLGADAIIIGKILGIKGDKVGINFKVIHTNTMELLTISYIELYKDNFLDKSGYHNDILLRERQLNDFNAYKHRVKKHIAIQKTKARNNFKNFNRK